MAYVLRWLNLILILVFFVIALVATLPPITLFSFKLDIFSQSGSIRASMWDIQTSAITMDLGGHQSTVAPQGDAVRINYLNCTEQRSRVRAMQAFSIAGTVFGFYAFLICLLMCACKLKVKLPLFLFLLLAFISELVLLIMGAIVYTKEACKNRQNYFPAFKDQGYKIAVGYILQIIACAGYLICFIITPFTQELWCGNC